MRKIPTRPIAVIFILSVLVFESYSYYAAAYLPKKPQPTTSTTYSGIGLKARGPAQPKWSTNHRKFASIKEAAPHINPAILFPTYTADRALGVIWVGTTKAQHKRTVIAMYEKGLPVNAVPLSNEDHQGYLQNFKLDKGIVELTVHGVSAYGTEPDETRPRGNPGQVRWWEDGVAYTVAGDGLPVRVLLKVAESMEPH